LVTSGYRTGTLGGGIDHYAGDDAVSAPVFNRRAQKSFNWGIVRRRAHELEDMTLSRRGDERTTMKLSDSPTVRSATEMNRTEPFDVVVADPHPLVRTGLRVLLERESTCRVTGEAASMTTLLWEVHRTRPAVVIADLDLPGAQHSAGLRDLPVPVLLVSEDEDFERIVGVLSERVRGFVRKSQSSAELIAAVHLVAAGHASLPPAITSRLLDAFLAENAAEAMQAPLAVTLTRREHDVLRLMAEGRSTGQIAEQLVVQTSTVKTHVYHLLRKLGVNDRAQAVALAYRRGLVSAGNRFPAAAFRRSTEAV
jgi:DNA-binding NarL/FixJ family response regulator